MVVVGGGLAGATLARAMAADGAQVLVLERERAFRDRVRGDLLYPWGVDEARRLQVLDLLMGSVAREARFWVSQLKGAPPAAPRDLPTTTPHRAPALTFFHPDMQTLLLLAAEQAGAVVERGASVIGVERAATTRSFEAHQQGPSSVGRGSGAARSNGAVEGGRYPRVRFRTSAGERTASARLVVGADGRSSMVRSWAGFGARRDAERLVLAGALLEGVALPGVRAPDDAVHVFLHPSAGLLGMIAAVGSGRFRVYAGYAQAGEERHLSGAGALPAFLRVVVEAGAPASWFDDARLVGPLAAYQGADTWVERPYGGGVVLVGDAAAANDPSWGCGTAMTLRDVRTLADALRADADWERAAQRYAAEHDRSYAALHRVTAWSTAVFRTPGAEADALRARVLPLLREDASRAPDVVGAGPDAPSDEAARRRFFGEDVGDG